MNQNALVEALLPCPFCGSAPMLFQQFQEVKCSNRECPGMAAAFDVKGWNTRAAHPRTEEEPITAAAINALPAPLRSYIHQLETRCDPNGEIRELIGLREQNAQLAALVAELEAKPQGITDGEILDWLEKERPNALCLCTWSGSPEANQGQYQAPDGHIWEINDEFRNVSLRAAIIDAMQSTPPATDEEVRE